MGFGTGRRGLNYFIQAHVTVLLECRDTDCYGVVIAVRDAFVMKDRGLVMEMYPRIVLNM